MLMLTRADLEAALAFAADLGAMVDEQARADDFVLEQIARLIPVDFAGYYHLDGACRVITEAEYGATGGLDSDEALAVDVTELPFCVYRRRAGSPFFTARRLSDVVDLAAFRRTRLFALLGAAPAIQMRMPGGRDTHWTLDLDRAGRDFSDRDLLVLNTLRPALMGYERYRALAAQVKALQAPAAREVVDDVLTRRESEVLNLVAAGASNGEIATGLRIAPGTVKKHLDNIYEKLEVGTRIGALAATGRAPASR